MVDEYLAVRAILGEPPEVPGEGSVALSYGRAYRLTRALTQPGPGRLRVRGRFTRLADALGPRDQQVLYEWLARPDPSVLTVVDPRPLIRTAAALQNTYAISLLQAETLAAAVEYEWPVRFGDPDSASAALHRAVLELGLDLVVITT